LSDEFVALLVAGPKGGRMLFRDVVLGGAQLRRVGIVAGAVLVSTPLVAAAAPRHDAAPARSSAAVAGVVYGGVTADGFGLMVEVSKSRRRIVRMATGLHLPCAAGGFTRGPDGWRNLAISKRGRFSAAFGPEVNRNDDGTTVDAEGTVAGRFNSSRTKVSGTWTLKLTFRDATGVITDTCDTGIVNWTAKQ
jgi:hypothetical protein